MAEIELTGAQRDALDLTRNVAVTAGAGSGKTGVLVRRYIDLLGPDQNAGVRNVLAITFTDKAAAEMKTRVRDELEKRIDRGENALHWRSVLENLDRAAISTIHSFCAMLLREHPVEAEIDPLFETLDAAQSSRLLREAADDALQSAGEEDNDLCRHAEVLLRTWGRARATANVVTLLRRAVCEEWTAFYDRASDKDVRKKIRSLVEEESRRKTRLLFSQDVIGRLCSFECAVTDRIEEARETVLANLRKGLRLVNRERVLELLGELNTITLRGGGAKNWDDLQGCKALLKEIKERASELEALTPGEADWNSIPLLRALSAMCLRAREIYEQYKGEGKALDFDDLQARALHLLQHNKGNIRGELRRRFRSVLVDEFQDTNHLQWEIVRLIVEEPDETIPEGSLFIVGDPKQSIYGFRDAEIRVFEQVKGRFIANEGRVEMDDNFRAAPAPVNFINSLMTDLMGASGLDYDPGYRPLVCRRDTPVEGSVTLLLPAKASGTDGEAAATEAELVARQLQVFVSQGCTVWDKEEQIERPARWGDIAILFRARTRLSLFEDALRKAGIPFTVAGGFAFYQRQEVLDAANVLRFLLHQGDDIALAALLRSPIAGLSDEALFRICRIEGRTLWAKLQKAGEAEVADEASALQRTRELICTWLRWSRRMPVAELLSRILTQTGLWGAVAGGERGVQTIANIEKVLGIARSAPDLAACVARLNEMMQTGEREAEAPIEFDEADSVKLLTVHSAKGLEFPIVCVADTAGQAHGFVPDVYVHRDHGFGVKARGAAGNITDTVTRNLIRERIADEAKAESVRQLYVALTRGRDHLVISGARPSRRSGKSTWLEMICEQMEIDVADPSDIEGATVHVDGSRIDVAEPAPPPSRDALLDRYERAARCAGNEGERADGRFALVGSVAGRAILPRFSPTGLMRYLECPYCYFLTNVLGVPSEGALSDEIPAHGGAFSAPSPGLLFGRVAHRMFEDISHIEPGAERQALLRYIEEEEIADRAERERLIEHISRMADDFRASDFGATVLAAEEFYTEIAFTVRIGRGAVSGMMDRLYRDAEGWHVIDYKTDRIKEDGLAERCERYKPQLLMYSLAAGKLLGCEPPDAYIYFARLSKPVHVAISASEAGDFERRAADAIDRILNRQFDPVGDCGEGCEFRALELCAKIPNEG